MKLLMFEHCWLCFRVRMTAALKQMHLQEVVVLEDDTAAMVDLVGRRIVPILIKDDGQPMLESMDIVRFIDGLGEPVLTGDERPEIARWEAEISPKAARLTQPRYLLLGLPEFATVTALDHYQMRKRRTLGDLAEMRAESPRYIAELTPDLEALGQMIETPRGVNGALSLDDVRVLPILRSLGVVKGLRFPPSVRDYFETMIARINYQPLPSV